MPETYADGGASFVREVETGRADSAASAAPIAAQAGRWVEAPTRCRLIASNPHQSRWWETRGQIKMHGKVRVTCPRKTRIPNMFHTASLLERRIWGFDPIGTRGVFSRDWAYRGDAVAVSECVNNTTRTFGQGTIVDVDWISYSAWDRSADVDNPCGLASSSVIGLIRAAMGR